MKMIELAGEKFGRLTVIKREPTTDGLGFWLCQCDCGGQKVVRTALLRQGKTRSCGCLFIESGKVTARTHGMSKTKTYAAWCSMLNRCLNHRDKRNFPLYGGRGIKVCERWMTFENFYADMGDRPSGMTLDRQDVNGNYEPGNCRWATRQQQDNNKRDTINLTVDGVTKSLAEWCEERGLPYATVYRRLRNGVSASQALNQRSMRNGGKLNVTRRTEHTSTSESS